MQSKEEWTDSDLRSLVGLALNLPSLINCLKAQRILCFCRCQGRGLQRPHEWAFFRLSRGRQYSTTKIVHELVNTNRQNHLYYGHYPLCPLCNQEEETFQHVLVFPQAVTIQNAALEELIKSLRAIQTPDPVIEVIQHDFHHLLLNRDSTQV